MTEQQSFLLQRIDERFDAVSNDIQTFIAVEQRELLHATLQHFSPDLLKPLPATCIAEVVGVDIAQTIPRGTELCLSNQSSFRLSVMRDVALTAHRLTNLTVETVDLSHSIVILDFELDSSDREVDIYLNDSYGAASLWYYVLTQRVESISHQAELTSICIESAYPFDDLRSALHTPEQQFFLRLCLPQDIENNFQLEMKINTQDLFLSDLTLDSLRLNTLPLINTFHYSCEPFNILAPESNYAFTFDLPNSDDIRVVEVSNLNVFDPITMTRRELSFSKVEMNEACTQLSLNDTQEFHGKTIQCELKLCYSTVAAPVMKAAPKNALALQNKDVLILKVTSNYTSAAKDSSHCLALMQVFRGRLELLSDINLLRLFLQLVDGGRVHTELIMQLKKIVKQKKLRIQEGCLRQVNQITIEVDSDEENYAIYIFIQMLQALFRHLINSNEIFMCEIVFLRSDKIIKFKPVSGANLCI